MGSFWKRSVDFYWWISLVGVVVCLVVIDYWFYFFGLFGRFYYGYLVGIIVVGLGSLVIVLVYIV